MTRSQVSAQIHGIDERDFHWLIGILEGEGTFLAAPPSAPGLPVVRVSMTDRDIVERVAHLIDRAMLPLRKRQAHHKQAFATTIKGRPAVELMRAIRRHMGYARQTEIDRAIASWHGGRSRRRNPPKLCGVSGCSRAGSQRGLCGRHYGWWKATSTGRLPAVIPITPPSHFTDVAPPDQCGEVCDLMWLAGLLEGEGCFTISKDGTYAYPIISVKMCDQDIVLRAARQLGASGTTRQEPRREGWNVTYSAKIGGHDAEVWMRMLRPFMGRRRAAAIDGALSAYHPIRLVTPPQTCVVVGCAAAHRARGLCHKHYMMWLRDREGGRTARVTPLR